MKCAHADRHNAKLVCGYPIPCPFHTVMIDATRAMTTDVEIPIARSAVVTNASRLLDIGDAVGPKRKKRAR